MPATSPEGHVSLVSGWQGDVTPTPTNQTIVVPVARQRDGSPVTGPVLARFFAGLVEGRLDLRSPDHLRNLLLFMARNSFLQHARSNQARHGIVRRIRRTQYADRGGNERTRLGCAAHR